MMSKEESEDLPTQREASAAGPKARKGGPGREDWIGAHLRKVYDEALSEPVPERFMELLKEIDRKESDRKEPRS